jgi:REP element-mobilizing transposase RayT
MEINCQATIFPFMTAAITEYPQFFTATNLEWKKILQPDKYKDIIIESLRFLVMNNRIKLYSFVIMANHIHLIWQMCAGIDTKAVQRDFLKFNSQRIKADCAKNHPAVLEQLRVDGKDRKYQLWERNPLSVELRTSKVFLQKLGYIHKNPVRGGLCTFPEEYKYSSAQFYETNVDNWGFLTHYGD